MGEDQGSAGFPLVIAGVTGILSFVVLLQARSGREAPNQDGLDLIDQAEMVQPAYRARNDIAVNFVILTVLYVAALALELVSFGISTSLFLFIALSVLTGFARKSLATNVLVAVFLGFGSELLFTQVFAVDLP